MDWGLLGYYVGEIVQDEIPVLDGLWSQPDLVKLKHFGAAAASCHRHLRGAGTAYRL